MREALISATGKHDVFSGEVWNDPHFTREDVVLASCGDERLSHASLAARRSSENSVRISKSSEVLSSGSPQDRQSGSLDRASNAESAGLDSTSDRRGC